MEQLTWFLLGITTSFIITTLVFRWLLNKYGIDKEEQWGMTTLSNMIVANSGISRGESRVLTISIIPSIISILVLAKSKLLPELENALLMMGLFFGYGIFLVIYCHRHRKINGSHKDDNFELKK